jgi:hypothetical protein
LGKYPEFKIFFGNFDLTFVTLTFDLYFWCSNISEGCIK